MTEVPAGGAQVRPALAVQIVVVLSRIQSRLRREVGETAGRAGAASSVAMLQRLAENGPMAVSELAESEHVTHQAIGKRVSGLLPGGYVVLETDPSDRRRKVVRITDAGRSLLDMIATREDWLARRIAAVVTEDELPTLTKAVELLGRLAAADVPDRQP